MRINSICIKNYRSIDEMTIFFPSQFTVLIGDNATGKTTILDALSIAMGCFLLGLDKQYLSPQTNTPRTITLDDIRRVAFSRKEIADQFPVIIQAEGSVIGQWISWKRELLKKSKKTTATTKDAKTIIDLANQAQELTRNIDTHKTITLPILAYHGTGRLWAEHREKIEYKTQGTRLEGYLDCTSPKSSGKQFKAWFKTLEDEVRKFEEPEDILQLRAIKDVLRQVVPEWEDIAFSFAEDDLLGFFKTKEGKNKYLPFRMLSDGYKNMIGMVADIAYRCMKLNPHLGEQAVKETPGIILIDELDLHLHPKWQKKIVEDLKTTFPKLQFVVTTHSPFIIQSLKADEIIKLDGDKEVTNDPFRDSIEEIAENVMDVPHVERSNLFKEMERNAAKYFDLIAKGQNSINSPEAAEIKEKLDLIELNYSDDPAYVALMKAERASQNIEL
jgi:predicted ATP-binding protein involved in virulence